MRSKHGTKTKKNYEQKASSSEETVWTIVCEGSPWRRNETTGSRIYEKSKFKAESGRVREL